MSADRWSVCPRCVTRSRALLAEFEKQHYGVLDAQLYADTIVELREAVKAVSSYSREKHVPDAGVLERLDEVGLEVRWLDTDFSPREFLFSGHVSTCLREDFGLGVDEVGLVWVQYSAECERCGFSKRYDYAEDEDESAESTGGVA